MRLDKLFNRVDFCAGTAGERIGDGLEEGLLALVVGEEGFVGEEDEALFLERCSGHCRNYTYPTKMRSDFIILAT